jgi:hypothetical protein
MSNVRVAQRLILGGGPTGLILGAIHGFPVVTDDIRTPNGPIYLYETPMTKIFMKSIGFEDVPTKEISIGYYFRGKVSDEPSEMSVLEYSLKMKKRTPYIPTKFRYFDISWKTLMSRVLEKNSEVYLDKIQTIDLTNHELHSDVGNVYRWNILISTIPAPLFKRLSGNVLPWGFKFIPVNHVKWLKTWTFTTDADSPKQQDWSKFDYVYFCDYDDRRIRWTNDGTVESISDRMIEGMSRYRIIDGLVTNVKDVQFAGRFARWDESRLISDDIEEAIKSC